MALTLNPFTGTLDFVGTGGGGGSITGGGTATEVAFFTAATAIGSDAGLFYLPVSGGGPRLGIGTQTPGTDLEILHSGGSVGQRLVQFTANAIGPTLLMRKARGIVSAPGQTVQDDELGNFQFQGTDETGTFGPNVAFINAKAAQTFTTTPTAQGTYLRFGTTPLNTTGVLERMRIEEDGSVLIGTPTKVAGSRVLITGGALHVLNAAVRIGPVVNFTSFTDPVHSPAVPIAYTLPAAQASAAGQILANDGAGVLSWIAAPSTVPSGPAGGDLSGTYPNPTVARINGTLLGTTTATDGTLLVGDTASSSWISRTLSNDATLSNTGVLTLVNTGPGAITRGTATRSPTVAIDTKGRVTALSDNVITLAGDVTGNVTAAVVAKINGSTLGTTSALDGRILIAETVSASWISRIVSGDATLGSTGTLVLVNTGPGVTGPIGDATHTPTISIDAKGRVTALTSTLITGVVPAAHNFLDPAVHNNTVLGTPVRGDVIVSNATPAWARLPIPAAAVRYLRSNGTDTLWADVSAAGGLDDFTGYTRLAGRATTTNNTLLSNSGGAGTGGTLSGSNQQAGQLILQGSTVAAPNAGTSCGTIRINPNLTTLQGVVNVFMTADADFTMSSAFVKGFCFGLKQDGSSSIWSLSSAIGGNHQLFLLAPTIQQNVAGTSRALGTLGLLVNNAAVQTNGGGTLTATMNAFLHAPNYTGGIGTCTIADDAAMICQPAMDATATVTLRTGLRYLDQVSPSTGKQLTTIAVDVSDQTSNAALTFAAALRSGIADVGNATKMFLQDTGGARSEFAGMFTRYKNVPTKGWGIPGINGYNRSVGATAAVASVATFTVGAADGTFSVSGNVLVTTSTSHSFSLQVDYTDEGGTARTATLNVQQLGGTLITTITNLTGAGPYEGIPLHIRAKAATAITVKTTGTFTTVTYNVEGAIVQVA